MFKISVSRAPKHYIKHSIITTFLLSTTYRYKLVVFFKSFYFNFSLRSFIYAIRARIVRPLLLIILIYLLTSNKSSKFKNSLNFYIKASIFFLSRYIRGSSVTSWSSSKPTSFNFFYKTGFMSLYSRNELGVIEFYSARVKLAILFV